MRVSICNIVLVLLLFAVPAVAQPTPLPPQELANRQHSWALVAAGNELLQSGDFAGAEADARTALVLCPINANADAVLAEALSAQGEKAEAIAIYRGLIYQYPRNSSSVAQDVRTRMHFAILLSQVGQWPEAVSIYEKALPETTHFGDAPRIDVHFDPHVPMPDQLQALAYVAAGLEYTGHGETTEAFHEYEKASHIAPNSPFANYYYGYGWRDLGPKDKAKLLNQEQAKAAFAKAVLLGKGDLKKAAEKALRDLNKPAGKPA